ncbi:hypothetical protein KR067_007821 [Drosophila pandora]|nr:hypothetical protein KR067_007821 [Drosophila pandora]
MKLLCSVLILASVLAAQAMPNVQLQLQSALDKYLVHARDLDTIITPDVTSQCFSLYLPMLNEVAATFSSSYQDCISTANAQIANLTAEATTQQKEYQQEVSTLCGAFATCDKGNDTTTFFNCYASAAEGDVSTIYDIATNAASSASSLSMGIKAVQDTEYLCTNSTESNYVRDTAATYDLLDNCLKYGVPTTSSAATVAPTLAPSTSSPAASTSGAVSTPGTSTPVAVTTPRPGTPAPVTSAPTGTPAP